MGRAEKQLRRRHRREKHGRSARHYHNNSPEFGGRGRELKLLEYDIVDEPLDPEEPASQAFVRDTSEEQRAELYGLLSERPQEAIERLQELLLKYPGAPMLLNWLGNAYARAANWDEYEQTIRLNYQLNPSYVFARLGYAEMCLRTEGADAAAEALDHKFDLKLLYPHRSVFHLTEYLTFTSVVIRILLKTGEPRRAVSLLETMEKIAPDSEHARLMRDEIYSPLSWLRSWLERHAE